MAAVPRGTSLAMIERAYLRMLETLAHAGFLPVAAGRIDNHAARAFKQRANASRSSRSLGGLLKTRST